VLFRSSAAYTPISCKPLRRFLNNAEVGIFLNVKIVLEESDFFLLFEIVLQRAQVRRAVRYAVATFFVCAVYLLPAFFVQCRLTGWAVILAFQTTAFYFAFHSDLMRQALNDNGDMGRFWRRAAVVAAALSFLISGVTIGLVLPFSGDGRSNLTDVLPLLPAAVLTPVAFVVPVDCFAAELRSHREWMSLQIN